MSRWLWLVAVASCGRFDFGSTPPIDAPIDSTDAPVTSLIHHYPLKSDFTDVLGGPPLVGHGGTFVATGYQFGVNQGLSVVGVMPTSVYTIDLHFQLSEVVGYRKVIDFKALGSDAGLYVDDSTLQFVVIPVTGCPGSDCYTSAVLFVPGTAFELTLARDSTGIVTAYVNRALQFSFSDPGAVGAFDTAGEALDLFIDDTVTGTEASAGIVNDVEIYDAALSTAAIVAQP